MTWVRRQSVTCLVIGNACASWVRIVGNCSNVAFSEVSSGPRSAGASDRRQLAEPSPVTSIEERRGDA